MCKKLISPVATYGTESWTFYKDIAKLFATLERRILGRTFVEFTVNENWRN
jgi:hypothetical protein